MKKDFMFCGGIEDTFIADPYPATGKTLDEYELTGHYNNFLKDFELVSSLGIKGLRWGIPWYKVEREKGKFDFSFTDKAIEKLDSLGITVILDLMHYGTPLWLENAFVEDSYADRVCEYTRAVLEHYKGVIHYVTPFNEPHTAAEFCGKLAQWPPYLNNDRGYFEVMKNIVLGAQEQSRIVKSLNMETVHIECTGGSFTEDEELQELAYTDTAKQSSFFYFLTGDVTGIEKFVEYGFRTGGLCEKDIDAFERGKTDIGIMGINFYPQFSFKDIRKEGDSIVYSNHAMWVNDLDDILRKRYERFSCPMLITETSVRDDEELKKKWIEESLKYCLECRYPLLGYTYFPLIDMVDWEWRLDGGSDLSPYIARFGLYDRKRKERPAAQTYRAFAEGGAFR